MKRYRYATHTFYDPKVQDERINAMADEGWEPHLMTALVVPFGVNNHREVVIMVFRKEHEEKET